MPKSPKPSHGLPEDDAPLAQAINRLADEVRVLRIAIDELREEVQYGVRNLVDRPTPGSRTRRITSMPADPAADDFAERVNAYGHDELPDGTASQVAPMQPGPFKSPLKKLFTEPGDQGRLF